MQPTEEFTGLGMPVFAAFGWAGEETAQNYAFSQLEQFAALLNANLPQTLRNDMPYFGLSEDDQSAYLAAEEAVEDDVHITFNARPTSLETQLALTNKAALARAQKQIAKSRDVFFHLLRQLDSNWTLRLQQAQFDEDTAEQIHYQDIYKGPISGLDDETLVEIFEKADYLNGEDKWVTPFYLSMLTPADQAAAMQKSIIPVMAERLSPLAPIVVTLRGRSTDSLPESISSAMEADEPRPQQEIPAHLLEQAAKPLTKEEFVFIGELRPLHLKRGFINMTPEHWPFFAFNARTEARPVTVIAADVRDEDSSVWRLQPNNLARLVLGDKAHRWLEDNFVPGDYVQVTATRINDAEIQIVLDMIN